MPRLRRLLLAVVLAAVARPAHPFTELESAQIRRFQGYLRIRTSHPSPDYPVCTKAGIPSPTGFVMNMQPSEAEVDFDLCLPPTEDTEHIIRRINEEWAPAHQNFTYQLMKKGPTRDVAGRPIFTPTNASNPWWSVFEQAIISAGEN